MPQVFQVLHQADPADHVGEITPAQHTTAGVHVVLLDLLRNVRQGHVILLHLVGIHLDLVLGGDAAVVAHVRHTRHLLQSRDDHPFMQVGHLAQVQPITLHDVAKDLARRRGQGIQSRHRVIRQLHIHQPLLHPLAGPIVIDAIVEDQHHRR